MRTLILTVRSGPVIYPFWIAIFPILFLWAHNIGGFSQPVGVVEIIVPLVLSTGFTALILVFGGIVLRDLRKTGLLVLLFLISFYAYGHVYTSLQNAGIGDSSRQWLFSLAWASGFLSVGLITLTLKTELKGLTNYLNISGGLLVIFSLFNIGTYTFSSGTGFQNQSIAESGTFQVDVSNAGALPDIYYIVPDSYASSQILGDLGHDNSGFTDFLTSKGFFVAFGSDSNYLHTELSLASTLNMEYLNDIEGSLPGDTFASFLYHDLINEGRVLDTLRSFGYTIVNTRDKWMVRDGNRRQLNCSDRSYVRLQADDYTGALVGTTALYPVLRHFNVLERQIWDQRLCDFSLIVDAKDIKGPKFVFSHLRVPHPPFIFDRDGIRDPDSLDTVEFSDKPEEYVDQLIFVNKKLREIVQALLSVNENPPIIIIQSDHGTRLGNPPSDAELYRVRFGILNAIHLPNGDNGMLYDSISPVNTFRVIFDRYFGTGYGLLDDRSYNTDPPFAGSTHVDVTGLIND